jgi:hypothetical protein
MWVRRRRGPALQTGGMVIVKRHMLLLYGLMGSLCSAQSPWTAPPSAPLTAFAYKVQASKLYPLMGLTVKVQDQIQLLAEGSEYSRKAPLGYQMTLAYQDASDPSASEKTFSCMVLAASPMCFFTVADATLITFRSLDVNEITLTASKHVDVTP